MSGHSTPTNGAGTHLSSRAVRQRVSSDSVVTIGSWLSSPNRTLLADLSMPSLSDFDSSKAPSTISFRHLRIDAKRRSRHSSTNSSARLTPKPRSIISESVDRGESMACDFDTPLSSRSSPPLLSPLHTATILIPEKLKELPDESVKKLDVKRFLSKLHPKKLSQCILSECLASRMKLCRPIRALDAMVRARKASTPGKRQYAIGPPFNNLVHKDPQTGQFHHLPEEWQPPPTSLEHINSPSTGPSSKGSKATPADLPPNGPMNQASHRARRRTQSHAPLLDRPRQGCPMPGNARAGRRLALESEPSSEDLPPPVPAKDTLLGRCRVRTEVHRPTNALANPAEHPSMSHTPGSTDLSQNDNIEALEAFPTLTFPPPTTNSPVRTVFAATHRTARSAAPYGFL